MNVPSNQDFSERSSNFDVANLESLYKKFINESFQDFARNITLHLQPSVVADTSTVNLRPPQQYNPILGGVFQPTANTRNPGVVVTPRDVIYKAHIKIGPRAGDDAMGIGDLKENEAAVTIPIEALPHLKETISVSIEGRRYSVLENRPIGFSERRYIIVKLKEINETEVPSPDRNIG